MTNNLSLMKVIYKLRDSCFVREGKCKLADLVTWEAFYSCWKCNSLFDLKPKLSRFCIISLSIWISLRMEKLCFDVEKSILLFLSMCVSGFDVFSILKCNQYLCQISLLSVSYSFLVFRRGMREIFSTYLLKVTCSWFEYFSYAFLHRSCSHESHGAQLILWNSHKNQSENINFHFRQSKAQHVSEIIDKKGF
jgi:hypothetical protein